MHELSEACKSAEIASRCKIVGENRTEMGGFSVTAGRVATLQ